MTQSMCLQWHCQQEHVQQQAQHGRLAPAHCLSSAPSGAQGGLSALATLFIAQRIWPVCSSSGWVRLICTWMSAGGICEGRAGGRVVGCTNRWARPRQGVNASEKTHYHCKASHTLAPNNGRQRHPSLSCGTPLCQPFPTHSTHIDAYLEKLAAIHASRVATIGSGLLQHVLRHDYLLKGSRAACLYIRVQSN